MESEREDVSKTTISNRHWSADLYRDEDNWREHGIVKTQDQKTSIPDFRLNNQMMTMPLMTMPSMMMPPMMMTDSGIDPAL